MNGVSINEKQFRNMNVTDQNVILFNNTEQIKLNMKVHTNLFEQHLKDDKFNFKVLRYMILGIGILGGLGKMFSLI